MRKTPLRRKRELARGSAPMKTVNRKRKASEFTRAYGSKERVAWVKSLGCMVSVWCEGPIDNAHTENGGKSRKGHYSTIVPLCRIHHRAFDEYEYSAVQRAAIIDYASHVEAKWQAHVGAALAVPRAGAQK